MVSHPARGAWIEIYYVRREGLLSPESHPARGAWIEITFFCDVLKIAASHPARGAWIEIFCDLLSVGRHPNVAPRPGCVD